MPLYDCGSVEIISGAGIDSVTIDSTNQNGSALEVSYTVEGSFAGSGRVETFIEISDRDSVAGRGAVAVDSATQSGDFTVSDTAFIDIEERPTASSGFLGNKLPVEVNVEATAGGETKTTTTDTEILPESLDRLEITNAEQDGSTVVVDFEVGGGSGFNIGEDDASNIGEVTVDNPVPWADGTEDWIPGLTQSGAARLLPDPTDLQLGAYDDNLTLEGDVTAATIEIPLGLTPPEQFGPVESFVGIGVTTENGTQLIDTYDITIDPVTWIDNIEASCSLNPTQIEPEGRSELTVSLTNNAGPAAFGSTVELDLRVTVTVDGTPADDNFNTIVIDQAGTETDGVLFGDVRGPRGVGSDGGGDTVSRSFDIIPIEPGEFDIAVEYEIPDGSAARIIPTDELL